MTEAEARDALAAFDGLGGLERWIAGQQPREAVMAGSTVPGDFQGWRFRLELEAFRDARLSVAQAVEPPTQRARLTLATWRGPAEPRPPGVPAVPRSY